MDIDIFFESVTTPLQIAGRIQMIKLLVEQGHLKLTYDELDDLVDHCREMCHKHGIDSEFIDLSEQAT